MIVNAAGKSLFFMHIPRTGGISLMQYLDQKFSPAAICPAHEMFEFEQLKQRDKLAGYSFYRGHFGIDLPRLVDPSPSVITFLRRPIARVFSTWRHLRSHAVPFQQETGRLVSRIQDMAVAAHSFDFEAFCQFAMEHHGPWFFNSMTVLCTQGRNPASTDTRWPHELLEDAKRLIDELSFVGFTETFDQSVARLQRRFGWLPETIAHANAAPPSEQSPGGKFHSWLADATAVDDQLYEYALKNSVDIIPRQTAEGMIMSTSTLAARVSERAVPLELRFVENEDELVAAARDGIAAGARRIRIEPPEAATAFISALAPDANSGLQFLSSTGAEQAEPPPSTVTAPEPEVDLVVIAASDPASIDAALMRCLDLKTGLVLALLTDHHWTRRPLFLISIPKAGTHLLRRLAEGFGYKRARICPPLPVGGSWYCIEGAQPHTAARQFFFSDAARDHPFLQSPALFIYRDPRDILVSEAHWYPRDEVLHLLKGYFGHLSLRERLLRSVDDPFCVGTIRERVAEYAAWLDLPNVVPLSFEELVGSAGNGDDSEQHRAVWSVQLKLQVDGRPADFAGGLFDRSSPTFHRGQIGGWRELFDDEVKQRFAALPQDFMHRYGYDPHGYAEQFPSYREQYRRRALEIHEVVAINTPYLAEADVNGFNIVRFRQRYYAVPQHGPKGNLRTFTDAELSALPSDPELASLRAKLESQPGLPLLERAMEEIAALERRVAALEQARDLDPQ